MRIETRMLLSLWVAAAAHPPRSRIAGWVLAALRRSVTRASRREKL